MPPYKPRLPPRAHQTDALRKCRDRPTSPSDQDVFAYLAEMGTGKSKMICDDWGELAWENEVDDLLLAAPTGVYLNWDTAPGERDPERYGELRKHLSEELFERTVVAPWVTGGRKVEKERYRNLLSVTDRKVKRVLMVNAEALSTAAKARELVR